MVLSDLFIAYDWVTHSHLVRFHVCPGALIEWHSQSIMCLCDVCTNGHYDVLEAHGRTHVRWQVQRHYITSALKHGGGEIPLVEVDICPAFLLALMSDESEK